MTNVSERPKHLPDFKKPPLNEVVLGVQFSIPQGYQQIRAGEVWKLFSEDYPQVQEHPALPPSFETFGIAQRQSLMPQFSLLTGGTHDRFWFLRPDSAELIQFQQDRLLHNWRNVTESTSTYPRFEAMIVAFKEELTLLQGYFSTLTSQTLMINQCEISYTNHIDYEKSDGGKSFSEWLKFLNFSGDSPDDFQMVFREVIRGEDNKPLGRLYVESALGIRPDGREIILLTLSVKGAPQNADIDSGLAFLALGRDIIVRRFTDLTTDQAHQKWERIK